MSEIDRKLKQEKQSQRQLEAERAGAAEEEIRTMVGRIPAEAQAALAVLENRGDSSGAVLKSVDRSRTRFGRTKQRSEEWAAWRLCSVAHGKYGDSYWLLSDGTIAIGDHFLYVVDIAEEYAADVKYRKVLGWNGGEGSSTWKAIREVYAALRSLQARDS